MYSMYFLSKASFLTIQYRSTNSRFYSQVHHGDIPENDLGLVLIGILLLFITKKYIISCDDPNRSTSLLSVWYFVRAYSSIDRSVVHCGMFCYGPPCFHTLQ